MTATEVATALMLMQLGGIHTVEEMVLYQALMVMLACLVLALPVV